MTDRQLSILVVNPNSSSSITSAISRSLKGHEPPNTSLSFFNPSTGPPGIHDPATTAASTDACMAELPDMLEQHGAILVACFSEHPLIQSLRDYCSSKGLSIVVMGIYHAGVATALLRTPGKFGIIATGTGEKPNLVAATAQFLGAEASTRFAGVITTGLSVVELQEGDPTHVERSMRSTTSKLLKKDAAVIVLGCGGMCGMEHWIVDTANQQGKSVQVIDGARMGVHLLVAMIRGA